jgi:hypothetical protein
LKNERINSKQEIKTRKKGANARCRIEKRSDLLGSFEEEAFYIDMDICTYIYIHHLLSPPFFSQARQRE